MAISIWNSALNILARREHSQLELRRKLILRFPEQLNEIEDVISRLKSKNLQSDQRFLDSWLAMQISNGRGPIRILYESKQKGIEELVHRSFSENPIDWCELALSVGRRKFKGGLQVADRPKVYRFLGYRGFEPESIQYAVSKLLKCSSVDK